MVLKNFQRSNWSMPEPVFVRRQDRIFVSENEQQQKKNFRHRFFQYCSSMSALVQGFVQGALVGCLLLSIALILWLTKTKIGMNGTTTASMLTSSETATVTYAPTGIYALTIPTCAMWNQTGITIAGNQNGSSGSDLGSLDAPVSIFVDNNDALVIADRDNHRVMKYYPNAASGIMVGGNNTPGNSSSQLYIPRGVVVDQSGAVIVADSGNYRIQKFVNGSLIGITLFSNTSSTPLGQTRDIHIDVNNNLYITDSDYNHVIKFSPYSSTGTVLAGGGTPGSASNQLYNPYGDFIDRYKTLYVADSGNARVMKYLSGVNDGSIVAGINSSSGSGMNQLKTPSAVVVDNNGYIYIADFKNHRIMKWTTNYTAGGTCVVGCTGTIGSGADQLSHPRDLKFDKYGNLYVSDQGNNRIQKFLIQISASCSTSG